MPADQHDRTDGPDAEDADEAEPDRDDPVRIGAGGIGLNAPSSVGVRSFRSAPHAPRAMYPPIAPPDSTAPVSPTVAVSWATIGVLFGVLIAASYPVASLAAVAVTVAVCLVRHTDRSSTFRERLFRTRTDGRFDPTGN